MQICNLQEKVRVLSYKPQHNMNSLTRTLAKIATSKPHQASRRWLALQYFHASTTPNRYTKSKKPSSLSAPTEWPRPSKIPYQSKVANSVCLSGFIHMPVQFEAATDGKFWAGTVISQNPSSDSPPLWYSSSPFPFYGFQSFSLYLFIQLI